MCKKRIVLWSICGFVASGLLAGILFPVHARSKGMSIYLYHHHSEACLGEVTKMQKADVYEHVERVSEDICPLCGATHNNYEFTALCSCGRFWYSTGHACYNSPYGSNPGGGCPNYASAEQDTTHEHVSVENVCGLEPEDVVGEIEISFSTTDPAPKVVLSATYKGRLNSPEMNWVEGEIEEDTKEEPAEEIIDEKTEDETENEPEDGTGAEADDEPETETDDEAGGDQPVKLGSSITVVKNGIYTLCTEYEEDGIFYTLNRSVTVDNIKKEEPKKESREPEVINTPPETESEIPPREEPPRPTKVLPATLVKEPKENTSEEPVAEVKEEVLPVKEETPSEPEIIPIPKPELVPKKDFLTRIMLLPPVVKTVSVISAGTLAGAAMIFYAWMILFQTARVMWVDEDGRAHSLARVFIHRESAGFALTIRSKALLRAERDEFKVVMPAIFAKVYRYQPVRLKFEERMYCLHVERTINLPTQE